MKRRPIHAEAIAVDVDNCYKPNRIRITVSITDAVPPGASIGTAHTRAGEIADRIVRMINGEA